MLLQISPNSPALAEFQVRSHSARLFPTSSAAQPVRGTAHDAAPIIAASPYHPPRSVQHHQRIRIMVRPSEQNNFWRLFQHSAPLREAVYLSKSVWSSVIYIVDVLPRFVPRFIRRMKVPDYKDKAVFGVPLLHNMQRFGQPLPQCIQHALAYLRRTALDQVGLFRKPGVRSRILKLRSNCENNPMLTSFEECSAYDVADMVKQYFRELPDPLMTLKLSETFIGIFLRKFINILCRFAEVFHFKLRIVQLTLFIFRRSQGFLAANASSSHHVAAWWVKGNATNFTLLPQWCRRSL